MKIEKMMSLSDAELRNHIFTVLDDMDAPYLYNKEYIVTDFEENLPLVCVHLDTVSLIKPLEEDILNHKGLTFLAPQSTSRCLGADDRAGVWIALEMLKSGTKTKFNYGFFDGEESGCIGSRSYAKNHPEINHQCFVGLDRASKGGVQNIASYGYDNDELTDLFTEHSGYKESSGSVSDCSSLASSFDKPCLNLSVGYDNEHSQREILSQDQMKETLEIMRTIVIPKVNYEVAKTTTVSWGRDYTKYDFGPTIYNSKMDMYPEAGDYLEDYEDFKEEAWPELCDECEAHEPLYYHTATKLSLCMGCLSMYGLSLDDVEEVV